MKFLRFSLCCALITTPLFSNVEKQDTKEMLNKLTKIAENLKVEQEQFKKMFTETAQSKQMNINIKNILTPEKIKTASGIIEEHLIAIAQPTKSFIEDVIKPEVTILKKRLIDVFDQDEETKEKVKDFTHTIKTKIEELRTETQVKQSLKNIEHEGKQVLTSLKKIF